MLKRAFDIVGSLVLLVTLPIMAVVALLVRVQLGKPVLFIQSRPGLHGRPFRMIKFRTMSEPGQTHNQPLADAERLGAFGRTLRSTSLDELPELFNVIIGDMSLVGPRPLLTEYLPLYSNEQARRHLVRPGITGWAQVCGRNAITWEEKFAKDVWYVDHQTFWLDVKILCLTIAQVLGRRGVTAQNEATVAKFTGTR